MNYRIYKKRPGVPKCLSELGDDGKPLHKFTYFKTWREAWHWLRSKHRGGVFETKCQFTCEVSDVRQADESHHCAVCGREMGRDAPSGCCSTECVKKGQDCLQESFTRRHGIAKG